MVRETHRASPSEQKLCQNLFDYTYVLILLVILISNAYAEAFIEKENVIQ